MTGRRANSAVAWIARHVDDAALVWAHTRATAEGWPKADLETELAARRIPLHSAPFEETRQPEEAA